MSFFTTEAPITITCHKRLAFYLEREVKELGFIVDEVFTTGIRMRGTLNNCIRLNLNLRCASQVLYSIQRFVARDADEVYQQLYPIAWEDILPADMYFSVTSNVTHPTINNGMYANLRVKDAIVDHLRDKLGIRPSTGAELTGAVIHLFWKNDDAEIFIDTSGDSLARHGYRKVPGRAPMLEALAAATIMATRWDKASPFINPMCGSGTLAIEAALLATNSCPGLFRMNYAFMHISGYVEQIYLEERGWLEQKIIDRPDLHIVATDYSGQAIANARKNALAAGVGDMITFEVCGFAQTEVPQPANGVVMINPEYGERLGDISALEAVYAGIGDFMKQRCGGYHGYVFTGNLELAKKIGLKAKRRMEFYTSTIDCRLLEYELYAGKKNLPQKDGVE